MLFDITLRLIVEQSFEILNVSNVHGNPEVDSGFSICAKELRETAARQKPTFSNETVSKELRETAPRQCVSQFRELREIAASN